MIRVQGLVGWWGGWKLAAAGPAAPQGLAEAVEPRQELEARGLYTEPFLNKKKL